MPWRVWILWGVFLARGCFYCTTIPLWEGWDEYAHFAYLQHAVSTFGLPRFDEPISKEIDESMRLAPLGDELRWIGPPYLTHPQWWALPEAERADRVRRLAAIPPEWAFQKAEHPFVFYEALQSPLYFWLLALPLRFIGAWHLWGRVLAMRLLSMALASLAIPLTFLAGRIVFEEYRAVLGAGLLALAPGFAIDASRVANDSLAIALAALLCCLVMKRSRWVVTGLVLGAGLLAKSYFLGLVLGFVLLGYWRSAGLGVLAAVWWYGRNVLLGYSLTGWQDQASFSKMLAAVTAVNWIDAAQVTAKSFFWFGGWSFLTLKSWMYAVVNLVGAVAAFRGFKREVLVPWVFVGCVFAEMAYGVLNYQASHGIGSLPGWYAWVVGGMMAMIIAAGGGRSVWFLIAALAAVDVYGASLMARHYHVGLVWLWLVPIDSMSLAVWLPGFRRGIAQTAHTAI